MSGKEPGKKTDLPHFEDTVNLASGNTAPRKADVERMFKVSKEKPGKEIEWVWSEAGRQFRLLTSFPVIVARDHWDYELRDDPTWTLSDDREHGNPIIWHYKTADLDLVYEITKMIEKKPARSWAHSIESSTAAAPQGPADSGCDRLLYAGDAQVEHLYAPGTGIYSYSAFLLFLKREYDWFASYGSPLSLVLFQIKTPVDGDNRLTHWLPPSTVQLLERRVVRRLSDTFGHFESFDFGLILPNTDTRQATQIAQRVSQILTRLPLDRNKPHILKVNCGVANLPANGDSIESLVAAAKGAKNQALGSEQVIAVARPDQRFQSPPPQAERKGKALEGAGGKIGLRELLVRTELVAEHIIENASILAKRMPLGRVLSMEGHVKESTVEAASELERMVASDALSSSDALLALKMVGGSDITLAAALKQMGVLRAELRANDFSDLLGQSGLVSAPALLAARRQSVLAGLTLGTVLTSSGQLSDTMLRAALAALQLVRRQVIGREQAVSLLDEMRLANLSLQQVLAKSGLREDVTELEPLGRDLLSSGQLSESELIIAREVQLVEGIELERAIISLGFLAPGTLESADGSA